MHLLFQLELILLPIRKLLLSCEGGVLTGQCSGAFSGTLEGRMADDGTSKGEGGGIACCVAIIAVL